MEKKITLMGEEVTIKFNLAVEIAYEDVVGRPFNLDDFKDKKYMPALFFAAVIANNHDTKVTIDYILSDATVEEIHALDEAVSETMSDWLHIPDIIKEDQPTNEDEEQPKN
jgi:hypothetical protein